MTINTSGTIVNNFIALGAGSFRIHTISFLALTAFRSWLAYSAQGDGLFAFEAFRSIFLRIKAIWATEAFCFWFTCITKGYDITIWALLQFILIEPFDTLATHWLSQTIFTSRNNFIAQFTFTIHWEVFIITKSTVLCPWTLETVEITRTFYTLLIVQKIYSIQATSAMLRGLTSYTTFQWDVAKDTMAWFIGIVIVLAATQTKTFIRTGFTMR